MRFHSARRKNEAQWKLHRLMTTPQMEMQASHYAKCEQVSTLVCIERHIVLKWPNVPDLNVVAVLRIYLNVNTVADMVSHQCFPERGFDAHPVFHGIHQNGGDKGENLLFVILLKVEGHRFVDANLVRGGVIFQNFGGPDHTLQIADAALVPVL